MKKSIALILLVATIIGCKKKDETLEFNIVGKEYAARWKVNNNNRQEYVHLKFETTGQVTLSTSTDKILFYGNEKLTYTKNGDSYVVVGTLNENYYKPIGTKINWAITPTKEPSYEGSTIKSSFEADGLTFIDQR